MIPMLITHKRAVNRRLSKKAKKLAIAVRKIGTARAVWSIAVEEPFSRRSSPFPCDKSSHNETAQEELEKKKSCCCY